MPYLKLTQYIEYKANEKGIKVVRIDERGSSRTCSKCGYASKANRKSQGLFKCKTCGFEINADVNGCRNILKFSQGYTPSERAEVTQPQTLGYSTYHQRSPHFRKWEKSQRYDKSISAEVC